MRRFLCFAALALASVALSQEVKVTYSTVAVSAKKALAELSVKSGLKFACSPAMEKEILILRLQDAPISEAMRQIAAVTSGDWKKEGEIYFLVVNGSARLREENRELQKRTDNVAKYLKSMLDMAAKAGKTSKDGKAADGDKEELRAMRSWGENVPLYKLAAAIGASRIAAIPVNGRAVYSSNPTRMQRDLPSAAPALIDEYIAEHNKWVAAAKQNQPAAVVVDDQTDAYRQMSERTSRRFSTISSAPAKALLVIDRSGRYDEFELELRLYDGAGKIMATTPAAISSYDGGDSPAPFDEDEQKPTPKPAPTGAEIQLSALAKEFSLTGMRGMDETGAKVKPSKEFLSALRDPVATDPLAFGYSEALIAVATDHKEQLVANLPDDILSTWSGPFSGEDKLTVDSFMADLKSLALTNIVEANGWLVVSPEDPVQARDRRTDRVALRDFIGRVERAGCASLDDLAAFAVKNGSPRDDAPASEVYFDQFAHTVFEPGMMDSLDWDMLRFYGMLNETERQTLRTTGQMPFSQLTSEQQNQLTKMLFGANESLDVENPELAAKAKLDPLAEMMMGDFGRGQAGEDDFRTEPTEAMPNGLPSNGTVVMKTKIEPVARPQMVGHDPGGMPSSLGAMELGLLKFCKEDPAMAKMSEQMPTFDEVKIGSRSTFDFSFYVAPQTLSKGRLTDDKFLKDAQIFKMNALPADFQKQIDEMAVLISKSPFIKSMGQFTERRPKAPPPQ